MLKKTLFLTLGGIATSSLVVASLTFADSKSPTTTERTAPMTKSPATTAEIRPFKVAIPEEAVVDLRSRVKMTRWPDKETVSDHSQGVELARLKPLVEYWGTGYDWRKAEAKLNQYPQFITRIDGLDIHFIHVRSKHPNAMPMIITHGWPGSIFEMLKTIDPLTNPTAHGGKAEDAFDVIIPSMPGYGFSEKPKTTGWGPDRMARAWDVLMKRLGYQKYVAQGGDWGSVVARAQGNQHPEGLLGIHVNMPATVPSDIAELLNRGAPAPAGLKADEKAAYNSMLDLYQRGGAYGAMMVTRPQTIGYSLADSPVGLAAWFYDKFEDWTYTGGKPEKALTKDEMLDDISLYWLTNTGTSGARLYWENNANNFNAKDVAVPVAVTVFPGEIYRAPKSWAEKTYSKLIYFHQVDKGGHFAAWEQPELFATEMRAAFKTLR